ncbi:hypothetical protein [Halodesulfovibrio sp.]|uniref:hypothetical protein n=1 Tax=Halodesulfovibrio sp. TaxID=1912772 RepID=UPI0025D82902|nr:hypothetical protein [Halodesulfovibrio sp.]MCT4625850.1 hypothetical protein [Halodesulfovibrio sp.]
MGKIKDCLMDVATDVLEPFFDAFQKEGIARDIPALGTLVGLARTANTVRDNLFLAKVKSFGENFEGVSEADKQKMRSRLENEEERQRIGEKLVFTLESADELTKAALLGKCFKIYLEGEIYCAGLYALWYSIDRCFVNDLCALPADGESVLAHSEVEWRLVAAGLMQLDSPMSEPQEQSNEAATEVNKEAQEEAEAQLMYELADKIGVSFDAELALLERFIEETASGNNSDTISVYQQALDPSQHDAIVAAFQQYTANHSNTNQTSTTQDQSQLQSLQQGLTVPQRREALKADIVSLGFAQQDIERAAGVSISGANSTQLSTLVEVLQHHITQPEASAQASPN